MTDTTRRLRVTGRVQGVFFRDWTVEQARALGLRGWVRNGPDGGVEVLASGTPAALDQLAVRCHDGPERARVEAVAVEDAADDGAAGFTRRGDG